MIVNAMPLTKTRVRKCRGFHDNEKGSRKAQGRRQQTGPEATDPGRDQDWRDEIEKNRIIVEYGREQSADRQCQRNRARRHPVSQRPAPVDWGRILRIFNGFGHARLDP